MKPVLNPSEAAFYFSFSGEDCLYRDHRGRRVIADIEGAGCFGVNHSEARVLTIADESESDMFQGSYVESLTVVALDHGPVSVHALRGRQAPISGETQTVALPYEGAGWLLSVDGQAELDSRREPAPPALPEWPAPFFHGIDGTGKAEIISSSSRAVLIDTFSIGDAQALKDRELRVQNISDVTPLSSTFFNGEKHEAPVASHLNTMSWISIVPENAEGLLIRKTYDRFHGRQRARVLVDGEVVGWWYEPLENRRDRWAVAEFGIPREPIQGKGSVRIAVDPAPGTPLWSVSVIETFALVTAEKV